MLDFLLSSTLGIGTNRRRDTTASSIVALLPELGPGRVRLLGEVPPAFVDALTAGGLEVGAGGDAHLVVVGPGGHEAGGAPAGGPVPQLWVGARPPWLEDRAVAGLARGGPPVPVEPRTGAARALALPFAPREATSTSPVARVQRVVGRARRRLRSGASAPDAAERGVLDALYGRGPVPGDPTATIVLPAGQAATALPSYLRRRLDEAGVVTTGAEWRLLADGEYPSQKLAWFLSSGAVVKLSRDAAFSPRLHNEHAALRLLADAGVARPGLPVPRLDADVEGLALVVEGAVDGEPFSRHGRSEPGDRVLASAFDEVLAVTTAPPLRSVAAAGEVARDLGALAERFAAVYGRSAALDAAVASLSGDPLPTTLQHGDPGTWNLLVSDTGNVAVLDWENAESRGVPVADALFFATGVARRALDAAGRRPTPGAVIDRLLVDGAWATWTRSVLRRAAEAAGCDPRYVPALSVVGAAYQAVKEVPRLDPAAPSRGEWVRLLAALEPVAGRLSD